MEQYKKLSSHGSINIPVAMRRDLGLEPKDPMIVSTNEEGDIILKPYVPRCMYCGRQDQVHKVFGRYVCAGCAKKVCEALEKMNGGEANG